MNTSAVTFSTSSPEELETKLTADIKNPKVMSAKFAVLAISGPHVLAQPFEFTDISIKDLKNRLRSQAVELLLLPADDVELDFQIFSSSNEKINGVFICLPKKLLQQYIAVLNKTKLVLLKVTAQILAVSGSFLLQQKIAEERFCLMDFSKPNTICLSIFNNRQCELLREISYETFAEASLEVIRTLRSSCAKSIAKQFAQIYSLGDLSHAGELISQIKSDFNISVLTGNATDVTTALSTDNSYFSLNLMRNYVVSLSGRKKFHMVMRLVVFICVVINIGLTMRMKMNAKSLEAISASYTAAELEHARRLENQVKSL